jgi:Helicase associated domain
MRPLGNFAFSNCKSFKPNLDILKLSESTHKGTEWMQLAQWTRAQRRNFINRKYLAETGKKGTILTDHQMTKLASIGFRFHVTKQPDFNDRLQQLLRYKTVHGHVHVPRTYKQDNILGRWCGKIKAERASGKLDTESVAKLDAMGFDWALNSSRLPRADRQHHDHGGNHDSNNDDENDDDDDDCEE